MKLTREFLLQKLGSLMTHKRFIESVAYYELFSHGCLIDWRKYKAKLDIEIENLFDEVRNA